MAATATKEAPAKAAPENKAQIKPPKSVADPSNTAGAKGRNRYDFSDLSLMVALKAALGNPWTDSQDAATGANRKGTGTGLKALADAGGITKAEYDWYEARYPLALKAAAPHGCSFDGVNEALYQITGLQHVVTDDETGDSETLPGVPQVTLSQRYKTLVAEQVKAGVKESAIPKISRKKRVTRMTSAVSALL